MTKDYCKKCKTVTPHAKRLEGISSCNTCGQQH